MSNGSKPSETRCKQYRYLITTKANHLLLGGILTFVKPETEATASETAIREAAGSAQELGYDFDPFNLHLAIRPIGKLYKTI